MNTKGKTAPGTVEPLKDGAAVVVPLGKRNPLVAGADDVGEAPDGAGVADVADEAPMRTGPVLVPVLDPDPAAPIVPVHAAPTGQHATFPAASLAQTWFDGQQAALLPCAWQLLYPPGQPCLLKSRREKSE